MWGLMRKLAIPPSGQRNKIRCDDVTQRNYQLTGTPSICTYSVSDHTQAWEGNTHRSSRTNWNFLFFYSTWLWWKSQWKQSKVHFPITLMRRKCFLTAGLNTNMAVLDCTVVDIVPCCTLIPTWCVNIITMYCRWKMDQPVAKKVCTESSDDHLHHLEEELANACSQLADAHSQLADSQSQLKEAQGKLKTLTELVREVIEPGDFRNKMGQVATILQEQSQNGTVGAGMLLLEEFFLGRFTNGMDFQPWCRVGRSKKKWD